jgi:hypothetical protein
LADVTSGRKIKERKVTDFEVNPKVSMVGRL